MCGIPLDKSELYGMGGAASLHLPPIVLIVGPLKKENKYISDVHVKHLRYYICIPTSAMT